VDITSAQLYSTASYQAHDLTGIHLGGDMSGWNFAGQNLSDASYIGATLTDADFGRANLINASFERDTLTGGNFTEANLTNATFYDATLNDANFSQANLTNVDFVEATLTNADFTDAEVRGGRFSYTTTSGFTPAQLYSTASYQAHDLTGIDLSLNDLTNWNFAGQNLTNANLGGTTLTGADFTGAEVRDAVLGSAITPAQLYSTASYQAYDLRGISLSFNNLAGGNFAGQNLTNGNLLGANLTDANFRNANLANADFAMYLCHFGCRWISATLTDADLTAADARGAVFSDLSGATTANLIRPDGHIDGLDLDAGSLLVVRDYDGRPYDLASAILISVDQHLAIGAGGTLRMVFEADAWDSTISFAPGIPVTLGGTLELTFANDVNLAGQVGRTFHLFDWTGVTPTCAFAISSAYRWNLSNLYSTGEVTLMAVPESSPILLLSFALGTFASVGRGRSSLV
jgi:uncharacterized protein YjbI with pentapeptide repeats